MSQISSMFGHLPGMGALVETFEQAYTWGPYPRYWTGGYIDPSAADPGNSPTWELRPGLVMGKITATGTYKQYDPTATDGSQIASAVLPLALRMQDVITGVNTAKFYALMVSGGVQASKLLGLDNMARSQMSSLFYFDDVLPGNHWYPFETFLTKTANYQIVSTDNFTIFDNTGAGGEVDFTLPAIANGYYFGFRLMAAQTLKVSSKEGSNLVGTSLTQTFVSGANIGAGFEIYSNSLGTKWLVSNLSSGTQTLTFG